WIADLAFRQAGERAAQIVDRRQQILGKAGDRVFQLVLALALEPAAGVFRLGKRAQQPVLGLGELRLDLGEPRLRRRLDAFIRQFGIRQFGGVVGRRRSGADAARIVLFFDHASYPISRPIIFAV